MKIKNVTIAGAGVQGSQIVYNITMLDGTRTNNKKVLARAAKIKAEWIDKNKLGISTGEGSYKYPNPRYKDPDFSS